MWKTAVEGWAVGRLSCQKAGWGTAVGEVGSLVGLAEGAAEGATEAAGVGASGGASQGIGRGAQS
jgi:hypothetical protein